MMSSQSFTEAPYNLYKEPGDSADKNSSCEGADYTKIFDDYSDYVVTEPVNIYFIIEEEDCKRYEEDNCKRYEKSLSINPDDFLPGSYYIGEDGDYYIDCDCEIKGFPYCNQTDYLPGSYYNYKKDNDSGNSYYIGEDGEILCCEFFLVTLLKNCFSFYTSKNRS